MTAQNASSPHPAKKELSSWTRFFGNPIVGLVGTLASVIGVLLAVYFYVQATQFRELVYYVNPAQAIVVKTGEASRLRVLIGDRELKSDVTTAQIAIWNRGNEPIKPDDVLAPLTIRTNPSVPILEATIRRKSRDVVDIPLDQKHLEDGIVGISWNILEQGDGGVIQIVYAGSPENTKISISGVIEGQHVIGQLQYSGKILSSAEQVRLVQQLNSYYLFVVVLGFLSGGLFLYAGYPRQERRLLRLAVISVGIMFETFVIFLAISIFQSRVPAPPFGF